MAYGNTESRRRKQEVFTVKHYGVFDMIGPVSYTHLDVYKRQELQQKVFAVSQ